MHRGLVRARDVHGSVNTERGDDSLLPTIDRGYEIHAVCDSLGHLNVFANWESGLSTDGGNSKSESFWADSRDHSHISVINDTVERSSLVVKG